MRPPNPARRRVTGLAPHARRRRACPHALPGCQPERATALPEERERGRERERIRGLGRRMKMKIEIRCGVSGDGFKDDGAGGGEI